jgi:hypothetical protein
MSDKRASKQRADHRFPKAGRRCLASELEDSLQASYHQTTFEPFLKHPLALTSNDPLAQAASRA